MCKQADCRPQLLHQMVVILEAMPSVPQTVFILIMGNQVSQRAYTMQYNDKTVAKRISSLTAILGLW